MPGNNTYEAWIWRRIRKYRLQNPSGAAAETKLKPELKLKLKPKPMLKRKLKPTLKPTLKLKLNINIGLPGALQLRAATDSLPPGSGFTISGGHTLL
ncbi:MAG: hypothetical protein DHS20C17_08980 [Cyclobacteriaceae bacterium]|nr:MAG: hypothetical protein DHS20C17_08980 [Cyclobacteriaceae bacterium]